MHIKKNLHPFIILNQDQMNVNKKNKQTISAE